MPSSAPLPCRLRHPCGGCATSARPFGQAAYLVSRVATCTCKSCAPRADRGRRAAGRCRFFFAQQEFEEEAAHYKSPALAQTLPRLHHASANQAGTVVSRSGFVFPPFFIMERGIPLDTWAGQAVRGFGEVLTMVESLAKLLQVLHTEGLVHRDLKPGNSLLLMTSSVWKLLDVGIVERAGAPCGFPHPHLQVPCAATAALGCCFAALSQA